MRCDDVKSGSADTCPWTSAGEATGCGRRRRLTWPTRRPGSHRSSLHFGGNCLSLEDIAPLLHILDKQVDTSRHTSGHIFYSILYCFRHCLSTEHKTPHEYIRLLFETLHCRLKYTKTLLPWDSEIDSCIFNFNLFINTHQCNG